jgi:hypothetical protein
LFDTCSIVVQRLFNILAGLGVKNRLKEILNSLPEQLPRSRLEPYSDLIEAMRARNWTYRGIARCSRKNVESGFRQAIFIIS